MSEEKNNAYQAEEATPFINVTPLIDVLLVLLIIFMAISPSKPARFEAKVPAEPKDEQIQVKPNPLSLVVSIGSPEMKLSLNRDEMGDTSDTSKLTNALLTVFKDREVNGTFREGTNEVEKTVFIKAPRSIKYGEVVKVIDAVKAAGAQPVGLQVDDLPN